MPPHLTSLHDRHSAADDAAGPALPEAAGVPMPMSVTTRVLATPQLTIDPAAAKILMANGPAGCWLGADCPPEGVFVDAAMPGIATLRALCASNPVGTRTEAALTMWTALGVKSARCDVAIVAGNAGQPVAVVSIPDLDAPARAFGQPPVDGDRISGDTPQRTPPTTASEDDAAILAKIARRIREGQAMRASTPTGSASTPTPASGDTVAGAADPVAADAMATQRQDGSPDDAERPDERVTAVDRARSADLARLAHELKTPISAIVAAAEIMRDERLGPIDNPRYKSYAADIFESARHALYVINNLVDAEQSTHPGQPAQPRHTGGADTAPMPMVFAELDLNALVESCASSMRPLAEQAGLVLLANCEPGLPSVVADTTTVRQIALNLITNSVKFTPRGGTIRVSTVYRGDGPVVITVADNGRGMTADEIARSELDPANTGLVPRQGGGLGIGLPLVGALARANGAKVELQSSAGGGTTASVVFGKDRVVPK